MPKRYFEEKEIKAGIVSDDLRKALRLENKKVPIWIYRMRILGYPPGWLRNAEVSKSINVIDKPEDSEELERNKAQDPSSYNPDSFIEYPGFNCQIPNGTVDDCEKMGFPPMLPHQQLDTAKIGLKTPKVVPEKRIKIPSETNSLSGSSSIIELNSSSEEVASGNGNEDKSSKKEENESLSESKDEGNISIEAKVEKEENRKLELIAIGSPVPKGMVNQRPDLDKWSKGMDDLIYFQNLPDYTGRFDKMRNILKNVRGKLN